MTDVSSRHQTDFKNDGEKKIFYMQSFAEGSELIRSMIDHKKVLVLAMNGPGVGAGASWFQGSYDIFLAEEGAWLQVTFSQLGLIPEMGSAINFAQSMGVHRANDVLMFGGKTTVEELHAAGMVNKIFPKENFHEQVHAYLKDMLSERSGASMMEMKRLQNRSTRDARVLALFEATNALAERFVDGEPSRRMAAKAQELVGELRMSICICKKLTPEQTKEMLVNRRCRQCKLNVTNHEHVGRTILTQSATCDYCGWSSPHNMEHTCLMEIVLCSASQAVSTLTTAWVSN